MPLILNDNPNPQAVMLGRQHLRKVMLGGDVVWQKYRFPKSPTTGDLSLESLEHQGVKLTAVNQNGHLAFPMHFPPRRVGWQWYLDRLTFLSDEEIALSLQSIDALLVADVVGSDMHYPMFFFDRQPTEPFEFSDKLTFIANLPDIAGLALETIDGMLVADVDEGNMYFPMVFPERMPTDPANFFGKLTFIADDENDADYVQDFSINAYDPTKDFIKDFTVVAIEGENFVKEFDIPVIATKDFTKDFTIPVINVENYTKDFTIQAKQAVSFTKDFTITVPTISPPSPETTKLPVPTGLIVTNGGLGHSGYYLNVSWTIPAMTGGIPTIGGYTIQCATNTIFTANLIEFKTGGQFLPPQMPLSVTVGTKGIWYVRLKALRVVTPPSIPDSDWSSWKSVTVQ